MTTEVRGTQKAQRVAEYGANRSRAAGRVASRGHADVCAGQALRAARADCSSFGFGFWCTVSSTTFSSIGIVEGMAMMRGVRNAGCSICKTALGADVGTPVLEACFFGAKRASAASRALVRGEGHSARQTACDPCETAAVSDPVG